MSFVMTDCRGRHNSENNFLYLVKLLFINQSSHGGATPIRDTPRDDLSIRKSCLYGKVMCTSARPSARRGAFSRQNHTCSMQLRTSPVEALTKPCWTRWILEVSPWGNVPLIPPDVNFHPKIEKSDNEFQRFQR